MERGKLKSLVGIIENAGETPEIRCEYGTASEMDRMTKETTHLGLMLIN